MPGLLSVRHHDPCVYRVHLWEVPTGMTLSSVCTGGEDLKQLLPTARLQLLRLGWSHVPPSPRRRPCKPGAGRVRGTWSLTLPWPRPTPPCLSPSWSLGHPQVNTGSQWPFLTFIWSPRGTSVCARAVHCGPTTEHKRCLHPGAVPPASSRSLNFILSLRT